MNPAILLGMIRGAERIAAALLQRTPLDIITLYEPASTLLAAAGIPHRRFDDFATEAHRDSTFQRAEKLAQAMASQFYSAEFRNQWPQADAATWTDLRSILMGFLKRDLMEEVFLVDTLRRCMCEVDLRLVLVPEDYGRDSRTAILTAQRLGVPALHLLHGYPYQTQNAHDVVSANVIAVFSEHCKSIVESFGARPDQVVVTGNPFWDCYASPPAPDVKEAVCARLGLDASRPIIEYAMTGVHRFSAISLAHPRYHFDTAQAVIATFASLFRTHSDWQFVLRPHPIEPIPIEQFQAFAADAGLPKLFIDNETCEHILCVPDVFLCTHSNMGIEALLRGLPVINVALEAVGGPVFREGIGPLFEEHDAVIHVREQQEIAPAIEAAVLDHATRSGLAEGRAATIRRLNYANDGRATERLCALALDMVANNARFVTPVQRYPEFEPALVKAVGQESRCIQIVGRAAQHVARALQSSYPDATVRLADSLDSISAPCDTLVLSDPIPHTSEAVARLSRARALVSESGSVIALFRNGASPAALKAFMEGEWTPRRNHSDAPSDVGEFSYVGVEVALSRSGLELEALTPVDDMPSARGSEPTDGDTVSMNVMGWVVTSRPRVRRLSSYAAERLERKRRADLSNRIGERRFNKGDMAGAISAFAEAIKSWNEEALYFSNLAAALFLVQQVDNAWHRIREAIYLDPNHPMARANYRMIANALGKLDEAEHVLSLFGADQPD